MKGEITTFEYDQDKFLYAYLELFSLLYIDRDSHLKEREKEFFIENVKLNARGVPLIGKDASAILDGELKFHSRSYRFALKKKGWLIQTKDGIILPPAFDFKNGYPKELIFKFKFSVKQD